MRAYTHSSSNVLEDLLFGRRQPGIALGPAHLLFGDYVVMLTAPGAPRMPNGIECDARARTTESCVIGSGEVRTDSWIIGAGGAWDPLPRPAPIRSLRPIKPAGLIGVAGWGPGLTPAGDDLIAGYVAGLVLLHGLRRQAERLAMDAGARTSSLSRTLLRHAALGEVPEPVHSLLVSGDRTGLLRFGHSSGRWWLHGLTLAGLPRVEDAAGSRQVAR